MITMTNYDYESIDKLADANGGRVAVSLADHETAWNPASTKSLIHGPVTVLYERHPDGGWTATATVKILYKGEFVGRGVETGGAPWMFWHRVRLTEPFRADLLGDGVHYSFPFRDGDTVIDLPPVFELEGE